MRYRRIAAGLLAGATAIGLSSAGWADAAGVGNPAADNASPTPGSTSGPVQVPPVVVASPLLTPSQRLQTEGSTANGYRVDTVQNVGPLGDMPILDTPFSVNVMPLDLINNVQATTPDQLFKMNPSTQVYLPYGRMGETDVNIRGFDDPAVAEDGLRSTVYRMDLEDKERVEVIDGLTGFLFGPNNPGGMINYVLKRPTPYYLDSVTLGDAGGGTGYVHGDFGGPLDGGRIGYRLNIVGEDGSGVTDGSHLQRALFSGAVDVHLTDDILLQFDASYSDFHNQGLPATWIFIPGVLHPSALDNSKDWGQPYTSGDDPVAKAGASLTYRINDSLTWRSGIKFVHDDEEDFLLQNNLVTAPGSYLALIFRNANVLQETESAYSLMDATFRTGFVAHKITAGFYGDIFNIYQPPDRNNTAVFGGQTFGGPTFIPEPILPAGMLGRVESNHLAHSNFVIGDTMAIGKSWELLAGVNDARIIDKSSDYTSPGNPPISSYNKSELSPAASLIYKPLANVSTYATYIQGLEEGGIAPDTAANAFAVLPPITSSEYEVGAKAKWGNMLLTADLFRIARPNQFLDPADNVFKEEGNEIHQGLELGISGKVTEDLTLWGGVTLMRSRVADAQASSALDGKRPIGIGGVSDQLAKLYAEYVIRQVPGLTLTGGVYYTGSYYSDALNNDRLPGFVTADLGVRYATRIYGSPTTFRLNVDNVANENYWLSSQYLGMPRTFLFSVQTQF